MGGDHLPLMETKPLQPSRACGTSISSVLASGIFKKIVEDNSWLQIAVANEISQDIS